MRRPSGFKCFEDGTATAYLRIMFKRFIAMMTAYLLKRTEPFRLRLICPYNLKSSINKTKAQFRVVNEFREFSSNKSIGILS